MDGQILGRVQPRTNRSQAVWAGPEFEKSAIRMIQLNQKIEEPGALL
jgi:hypothetical protein